jgi:hypothetical protein
VRRRALRGGGAAHGRRLLPLQALPAPHRERLLRERADPAGDVRDHQGGDAVRTYRPEDDGWLKSFCSECGSQLFTTHPDNPELIAVRMGALDQDPGVRPSVHQFVDYAAPWEPVPDDGLPRFPERMAWE